MNNIFFLPEFLREGKALYDNLYPSRIIVGDKTKMGVDFANILKKLSLNDNVKIILMDSDEAEAVKLFSNTFLALRVAFFNELDTYSDANNLNAQDIIEGVSLDPRIGNYYNNPSFGYGGYCLTKDTKQLLANYKNVPQNIIKSIIDSNYTRKEYIANKIIEKKPRTIGIYRLVMKVDSDNFRESAIQDIIEILRKKENEIIVYEPNIVSDNFNGLKIIRSLSEFKQKSSVILANRITNELKDVLYKIYTRDIFNIN